MTPGAAYDDAHERVLRCVEVLRVLTMALDSGVDAIGPEERASLSTATQIALDEDRAARERFAYIPRPRDPL